MSKNFKIPICVNINFCQMDKSTNDTKKRKSDIAIDQSILNAPIKKQKSSKFDHSTIKPINLENTFTKSG